MGTNLNNTMHEEVVESYIYIYIHTFVEFWVIVFEFSSPFCRGRIWLLRHRQTEWIMSGEQFSQYGCVSTSVDGTNPGITMQKGFFRLHVIIVCQIPPHHHRFVPSTSQPHSLSTSISAPTPSSNNETLLRKLALLSLSGVSLFLMLPPRTVVRDPFVYLSNGMFNQHSNRPSASNTLDSYATIIPCEFSPK